MSSQCCETCVHWHKNVYLGHCLWRPKIDKLPHWVVTDASTAPYEGEYCEAYQPITDQQSVTEEV